MEPTPVETLYGSEVKPPVVKPPSLMDQLAGVFTEPVDLFRKLSERPVWGAAFSLSLGTIVAVSLLWALRVDAEGFLRPLLEANPRTAEKVDMVLPMAAKFLPVSTVINIVLFSFVALAGVAFLFWLVGKATPESEPPSYRQCVSAFSVVGLVGVPKSILLGVICLARQIGAARIDQLSPTALGFYLVPENIKLHAFLCALDLFTLATLALTYLAARHVMRLKAAGAVLCALIMAGLTIGLPVLLVR